jgi:hypothetical protein
MMKILFASEDPVPIIPMVVLPLETMFVFEHHEREIAADILQGLLQQDMADEFRTKLEGLLSNITDTLHVQ